MIELDWIKPEQVIELALQLAPFVCSLVFFVFLIWGSYHFLIGRHTHLGNEKLFSRQLIIMAMSLVAVIGVTLSLPVSESSRNQIISLLGLVISGVFAFSSSTVFANLMAGILLRVTKPFRIGDFITVQDYFGRVAERGLFDTEIQSENRELIAIPNTYLISHPITAVHSDGAIVSASLSLGYDLHHEQIENLLIKAAEKTGLNDAFVHITELGDFSVTYRVSGVLSEVKGLLTTRSNLYKSVLDALHSEGIEIMSPNYMNQRPVDPIKKVLPSPVRVKSNTGDSPRILLPEEIVFDKAEKAHQTDIERKILLNNLAQLETLLKDSEEEEKEGIKAFINATKARLKIIENKDSDKNPSSDGENSDQEPA